MSGPHLPPVPLPGSASEDRRPRDGFSCFPVRLPAVLHRCFLGKSRAAGTLSRSAVPAAAVLPAGVFSVASGSRSRLAQCGFCQREMFSIRVFPILKCLDIRQQYFHSNFPFRMSFFDKYFFKVTLVSKLSLIMILWAIFSNAGSAEPQIPHIPSISE